MPAERKVSEITREGLQQLLTKKVTEVAKEPEHSWTGEFCSYMKGKDGLPVVRLSLVNCKPDMDIWEGLRNPAQVGMYPLGLRDIWMHFAASNVKSTREDGSPNPLALPETFEEALKRYRRAVIISAVLGMNPELQELYALKIEQGDMAPADYYQRARGEISNIINKAIGKLALSLMAPTRAVVPMTSGNAEKIIERTRSTYYQGRYHGPCNHHFPQNSIAVMTGLMRFGANRLSFRDEAGLDGKVNRIFGSFASIVIFDEIDPVTEGANEINLLNAEKLARMRRINDYADAKPEITAQRYCTYNTIDSNGASVCGMCIEFCPSNALANSTPGPNGVLDDRIARQKHRFWEGALDFDYGNCSRDRNQKAQLYDDYVCGRCEAICAVRGIRKTAEEVATINNPTGTALD
jgi:NAD-dependent dihydropyrimidine dehydrogenase PreA subunit